jgi:hypothetical protein
MPGHTGDTLRYLRGSADYTPVYRKEDNLIFIPFTDATLHEIRGALESWFKMIWLGKVREICLEPPAGTLGCDPTHSVLLEGER